MVANNDRGRAWLESDLAMGVDSARVVDNGHAYALATKIHTDGTHGITRRPGSPLPARPSRFEPVCFRQVRPSSTTSRT